MNKKKSFLLMFDFVLLALFVFFDQLTKYYAVRNLKDQPSFKLIDGIFELYYLENRGAAFGMLQNHKFFFIFIAAAILAVIAYVLFKTPDRKMYLKLHIVLTLIASGAVGNMIDRVRYDYVVDFLYFSLINFPVFNVADIYVTVSAVYLVILLIFVYKDSDLDFLAFRVNR